uniref:Uncharacterized protein n=1 Tax=Oryza sativa subsp. japonica TaxID=39947 RepID=Q6Z919_ORYSJ|nr:hypothetical protein [Oryza sativa Japonica Group]
MRFWVRLPLGANFPGFNGVMLLVVGDVPVDSEAPVVSSSISLEFAGPVFEDAHRVAILFDL